MVHDHVIQINALSKRYRNIQALKGINLEVGRGEIFGFLGPNGAGKTTTIRCMLDLIRPTTGTIRVLGLDPQTDPVAVRARSGYLPGELRLDDNLTANQLLHHFAALRGDRVDWSYVRRLAEQLDLDLTRRIRNFSKGNKQKVGVVQALMHRPELLLLDEPTSGLDPLIQQQVLNLIRAAREGGTTVFFSSHILSEAQAVADRVAIIRDGEIVELADTESLLNRSVRRVTIRFRQPVDGALLSAVPGVTILYQDETSISAQVEGEMDALIKQLATHVVIDIEIERPSLEEIFLAYYQQADRVEVG